MGGVEQQAELHGVILAAAELQTTLIVGLDRIGAARADFRQHFGGGGQYRVRGPVLAADLRAVDPHRAFGTQVEFERRAQALLGQGSLERLDQLIDLSVHLVLLPSLPYCMVSIHEPIGDGIIAARWLPRRQRRTVLRQAEGSHA